LNRSGIPTSGHQGSENDLFFEIFEAVGGNTLVSRVCWPKTLKKSRTWKALLLTQRICSTTCKNEGYFGFPEQASVKVNWQNFEKCRPEEIVSAMYDLRPLSAEDIALLSAFAVLPAENIGYDMLKTLLDPADIRVFAAQLQNLHQKGWIEKNEVNNKSHFKCNPLCRR
jgi:hypothetical protein